MAESSHFQTLRCRKGPGDWRRLFSKSFGCSLLCKRNAIIKYERNSVKYKTSPEIRASARHQKLNGLISMLAFVLCELRGKQSDLGSLAGWLRLAEPRSSTKGLFC